MLTRKQLLVYGLLVISLVLVCLPRFNRQDLGFIGRFTSGGKSSQEILEDAGKYINYVEYFRGKKITEPLTAPFSYRPFVPWLASLLPFTPMTAINMVNLFSLLMALLFLNLLLAYLGFSFTWQIIGSCLFIFSFPTFYYGAIGNIDPVVICFLTIGTYFIFTEKWLWLFLSLIGGALVKETVVILLPVLFIYLWHQNYLKGKKIALFLMLSITFLLTYKLIKSFHPGVDAYFWWPSFDSFLFNIGRPRSWFCFIMGFGWPGFLSLAVFFLDRKTLREDRPVIDTLVTGLLSSMALFLYAMFSAHADGRFIWTSYPFSIPLALFVLDRRKSFILRFASNYQGDQ